MRIIRYAVVNKETHKPIYVNCDSTKARAFLETLENKEDFYIGYKWMSI